MTAATISDPGLDWVVFAGEDDGETCRYNYGSCSCQATHAGVYRPVTGNCEHIRTPVPYCLIHRDRILRDAAESDGLFCCYRCELKTIFYLVRMVSL